MKSKQNKLWTILFLSAFALTNCDPGMTGDLKVYNETNQVLTIKFSNNSKDTITNQIQPNDHVTVRVLDGLGNAKTFDCCPCRTYLYKIFSPLGTIKKDPTNKDNWIIPNKNKLTVNGSEPVKCEFHVTQADL